MNMLDKLTHSFSATMGIPSAFKEGSGSLITHNQTTKMWQFLLIKLLKFQKI